MGIHLFCTPDHSEYFNNTAWSTFISYAYRNRKKFPLISFMTAGTDIEVSELPDLYIELIAYEAYAPDEMKYAITIIQRLIEYAIENKLPIKIR